MIKTKQPRKPILIKLDPDIIEVLDEMAIKDRRSRANLIEVLIENEYKNRTKND